MLIPAFRLSLSSVIAVCYVTAPSHAASLPTQEFLAQTEVLAVFRPLQAILPLQDKAREQLALCSGAQALYHVTDVFCKLV